MTSGADNVAPGLTGGLARGRGAQLNPANRFEPISLEVLGEHLDELMVDQPDGAQVPTRVFRDNARSIINPVDSPDLSFKWSINPYRGCEHGCMYCYARPTHETFGLSSGLDFETKIFAKVDAPALLRRELGHSKWRGEGIMLSGITDPYQPVERRLGITRGLLAIMAECRQPVGIVTKNKLITRDLDHLVELARHHAVGVAMSLTSLDATLSAKMEPRASSPSARLEAIRTLSDAGVPVRVMLAPIIPAINDREIPNLLEAAAEAGATGAAFVVLRLPFALKELVSDWLRREFPERAEHVLSLIRQMLDGKLYDSTFGERQRGSGAWAEQIRQTFEVFRRRYGMEEIGRGGSLSSASFRPPRVGHDGQIGLFE